MVIALVIIPDYLSGDRAIQLVIADDMVISTQIPGKVKFVNLRSTITQMGQQVRPTEMYCQAAEVVHATVLED